VPFEGQGEVLQLRRAPDEVRRLQSRAELMADWPASSRIAVAVVLLGAAR
jgi:hypothetical protein